MKGKTLINKLLIKIMLLIKELNVKYHISFSTMLRIKVCPSAISIAVDVTEVYGCHLLHQPSFQ